jgi:alpha-N-acetylglucosaminidase
VNLPLAFVGQELAVLQVYTVEAGLNASDVTDHFFSGPAFLPWNRMGNMQVWGGPLQQSWLEGQFNMQLALLERMRSLGEAA